MMQLVELPSTKEPSKLERVGDALHKVLQRYADVIPGIISWQHNPSTNELRCGVALLTWCGTEEELNKLSNQADGYREDEFFAQNLPNFFEITGGYEREQVQQINKAHKLLKAQLPLLGIDAEPKIRVIKVSGKIAEICFVISEEDISISLEQLEEVASKFPLMSNPLDRRLSETRVSLIHQVVEVALDRMEGETLTCKIEELSPSILYSTQFDDKRKREIDFSVTILSFDRETGHYAGELESRDVQAAFSQLEQAGLTLRKYTNKDPIQGHFTLVHDQNLNDACINAAAEAFSKFKT